MVKRFTFFFLFVLLLPINTITSQHWLSKKGNEIFSYCRNHKKTTAVLLGALGFVSFVKGVAYIIDEATKQSVFNTSINCEDQNTPQRIFACSDLNGDFSEYEMKKFSSYAVHFQRYNHSQKGLGSGMDLQKDVQFLLHSLKKSCEQDDKNEKIKNLIQYNIFGRSYGSYVVFAALDALQDKDNNLLIKVEISDEQRIGICEKLKRGIIFIDSPFFDFKSGLYGLPAVVTELENTSRAEGGSSIASSLFSFLIRQCRTPLYYVILPIATNFRMYPGRFKSFREGIHPDCFQDYRVVLSTHKNDPISGGKECCENFINLSLKNDRLLNTINNEYCKETIIDEKIIKSNGDTTIYSHHEYFAEEDFVERIHNALHPKMPVLIVDEEDPQGHGLHNAVPLFKGLLEKNNNNSI